MNKLRELERALKALVPEQGRIARRIARRNARRRVFGAMRTLRNEVEAKYPAIKKVVVPKDPLQMAAERVTWREFEDKVIRRVQLDWDADLAQRFINYMAKSRDVSRRELSLSDMRGYAGICGEKEIKIDDRMSAIGKWKTLLHEVAHTLPGGHGHRRKFVLALAETYRGWREFLCSLRVAARKVER